MAYGTIKVDQVTFTNGGVDQTISVSGIVQSISGDITATGTIQGATVIGTSTVSGATVTGDAGAFTIITGGTAGFTTVTGATITGGHVTAASGTYTGNVTAAAFIPTGSSVPTNGVYLPSANNVAISTNGNGALFIDENGKFGIGTADPVAMLDITPEGASTAVFIRNGSSNFSAIGFRQYAGTGSSTAITANAEPSGYLGIIAGGFEKTRIDNSGSLLVGTSSPRTNFFNGTVRTTLQVENASSGSGFISSVLNANNTLGPGIVLGKSRGATLGTNTVVVSGDAIGTLSFQGADGTNFVEAAAIAAAVDGTPGTNDMPGRLVFSTTADGASVPTERMRLDSLGQNQVFTADVSGAACFSAHHEGGSGSTRLLFSGRYSATGTGSGTQSFRVESSGDVKNTNNSYGAISDLKLKENIVDATSQWDDLKALQVRNYNFKEGQTHTQIGLIAQEVELVSPGLVSEFPDLDEEGNDLGTVTKSVNYSVLYMKAVKALQEAMERIEVLEAKVTALEGN